MGDVTGPIASMPGARHPLPDGATCDVHPNRPAVARIQGETDSFGAELGDYCKQCLKRRNRPMPKWWTHGDCEWCKSKNVELADQRDYDEGTCGRVYRVCRPCRDRYAKRLEEERNERWDDGPWDGDE